MIINLQALIEKNTSNKSKYLEVQNKLNSITTKDYKFFLSRTYFTSSDGSQNTFCQRVFDTLELKKTKALIMFLAGNQYIIYNSKLKSLYTDFLHRIKLLGYRI